jgi:hypothetical protein
MLVFLEEWVLSTIQDKPSYMVHGPLSEPAMSDDPINGEDSRPRKLDYTYLVKAGRATRFGPDWSGCRCGAKTKAGAPCQKPAIRGKVRCQLHGGRSTGPRTAEGRQRIATANLKHGQKTKEQLKAQRELATAHKQINSALRQQIELMKQQGFLPKDWKP